MFIYVDRVRFTFEYTWKWNEVMNERGEILA